MPYGPDDPFLAAARNFGLPPTPAPDPLAPPAGYAEAFGNAGAPWESRPAPDLAAMAQESDPFLEYMRRRNGPKIDGPDLKPTAPTPATAPADPGGGYEESHATIDSPHRNPGPGPDPSGGYEEGRATIDPRIPQVIPGEPTVTPWNGPPPIEPGRTFAGPVGFMPAGPRDPVSFDPVGQYEEGRATLDPPGLAAADAVNGDAAGSQTDAAPDAADVLANDPELLARTEADRRAAMQAMQAKAMKESALAEEKALDDSIKAREAARQKAMADRAQIQADAADMANGSPAEQWFADAGVGQKIGAGVAAVFGGLMMGKTGGVNQGIDFVMKLADSAADQKWKAIETRRQMNGEDLADADTEFRTKEAIRMASREQAIRMLESELANYDPQGAQAIDKAKAIAALRDAEAANAAKLGETLWKRNLDAFNADTQRMGAVTEAAKAEDQSKLAWAKFQRAGQGGGGSGLFGKNVRLTADQWASLVPGLDAKRLPAGVPLNHDEVDKILGLQGKVGQQGVDAARGEGLGIENRTKAGALRVYDPRDPSRVLGDAKDEKAAQTVTEVLPSAVQATETIDRIIRIADASGGNSDLVKNKEWQQITADKAYLDNLIRVAERMGALDAGSQDLIGKMRGGVDPNSFIRDAGPGLRRLRANIVGKTQKTMNAAGLDGNSYTFPDRSDPPKATKDPEGARLAKRPLSGFAGGMAQVGAGRPDATLDETAYDKDALDILQARVERDKDPNAAASIADAATSAPNAPSRLAASRRLWEMVQAGNPQAKDAYDALDLAQRAAIVSRLPRADYNKALADLIPHLPGGED